MTATATPATIPAGSLHRARPDLVLVSVAPSQVAHVIVPARGRALTATGLVRPGHPTACGQPGRYRDVRRRVRDGLRLCFTCLQRLPELLAVDTAHRERADVEHAALARAGQPHLTRRDLDMLDLESGWWRHAGAALTARTTLVPGADGFRYFQVLNHLIDNPLAGTYAPETVRRLQQGRRDRQRRNSARRLGHVQ